MQKNTSPFKSVRCPSFFLAELRDASEECSFSKWTCNCSGAMNPLMQDGQMKPSADSADEGSAPGSSPVSKVSSVVDGERMGEANSA